MDKIKKELNIEIEKEIGFHKKNSFIEKFPKIYKSVLSVLRKISIKELNNDNFILIDKEMKKLSLKIGSEKVFIYCGNFSFKNKDVIIIEKVETIGTYYFDDYNIVRQLKGFKIGLKIGLKKHDKGINMVIPNENNNVGLFEKEKTTLPEKLDKFLLNKTETDE